MTLNKLKKILNGLSWDEQVDFEMSERYPESTQNRGDDLNRKVRQLAQQLTPSLLNALERDEGYLVWSLRLSPYVPGDASKERARRFLNHPRGRVRFWAARLMQESES